MSSDFRYRQHPAEELIKDSYDDGENTLNVYWLDESELDLAMQFRNAKYLNLAGSFISDSGLRRFAGFKQLEAITLSEAQQITGSAFDVFRDHPNLYELDLRFARRVDDAGMDSISEISHLGSLLVGGTQITDEGLKAICKLQGLVNLDLSGTAITDRGIKDACGAFPNLENLYIGGTRATRYCIRYLASLRQLRRLDLGEHELSTEFLRDLGQLKMVQELFLDGARVHPNDLASLQMLATLKVLDLGNIRLQGSNLQWIGELRRLESLSLCEAQIDDTTFCTLRLPASIRVLDLGLTDITTDTVGHLSQFASLRTLKLNFSYSSDSKAMATLSERLPNTEFIK